MLLPVVHNTSFYLFIYLFIYFDHGRGARSFTPSWHTALHPTHPLSSCRLCRYDFTKLLARLVGFVKDNCEELASAPNYPSKLVIRWLALAGRLHLDDLRELCLDRLRGMTREEREMAITVEVQVGADKQKKRVVREEVKILSRDVRDELLALFACL
jgi:hypothetical protein